MPRRQACEVTMACALLEETKGIGQLIGKAS
jgi:hypothetical protein